MYINFHLFVGLSTILYYFILKLYKKSIQTQQSQITSKSNFVYIFFIPILLYTSYYLYYTTDTPIIPLIKDLSESSQLLNTYPASLSS